MTKTNIIPNFFIIGAPKCGTTALCEYLRNNRKIFMSVPKEPHYFAEDFSEYRYVTSEKEYLKYFQDVTSEHIAVGEASVWYLYSTLAVSNIISFNSSAKIIALIRNPIEYLHSVHWQLFYNFDEEEKNFEKAWYLQKERSTGKKIPSTCRETKMLQYADVGKLGDQIEKVLGIVPDKQVKVILYDDFSSNTQEVYIDVLKFLEIPNDGRDIFQKVNVSKSHRFPVIGKFTEKPPNSLRYITRWYKRTFGIRSRLGYIDIIRNWNKNKLARKPLRPEFRRSLEDYFYEDITKISKLLNRDLSKWFKK